MAPSEIGIWWVRPSPPTTGRSAHRLVSGSQSNSSISPASSSASRSRADPRRGAQLPGVEGDVGVERGRTDHETGGSGRRSIRRRSSHPASGRSSTGAGLLVVALRSGARHAPAVPAGRVVVAGLPGMHDEDQTAGVPSAVQEPAQGRVARRTSSSGTSKPHRTSSAMAWPNIGGWVIEEADASGPNQADGGTGP